MDTVINRLVYGVLTTSLFVGSAMLWSRQAPPLFQGASVFAVVGAAVGVALAFRLLRAIGKVGGIEKKPEL